MLNEDRTLVHAGAAHGARPERLLIDDAANERPFSPGFLNCGGDRGYQSKVRYQPIGFELLPEKFTLSQLQHLYEAILETTLDKRNFRKKVLGFGLLVPLDETLMTGPHRPAQLFRFDGDKYKRLEKRGFHFEI